MGGRGSGYRGGRPTLDGRTCLLVRYCDRHKMLTPGVSGDLTWSREDGDGTWTATFETSETSLLLRYEVWASDGESEVDWEWRFPYVRVPCRFGGTRAYWSCPYCGRMCERLVNTSNGRQWGCRKCFRLLYLSQTLNREDRLDRRATRLYNRAGQEDEKGTVNKHKWMRWRTYKRLMERANEYAAASEEVSVWRIAKFLGMLTPKERAVLKSS